MRDIWSPRSSVCSRPRSVREIYRPAVQDLSEQAARNGHSNQDESILSVVNTCTPRSSRPCTEGGYSDKYSCPTPLYSNIGPEEMVKMAQTPQICFNTNNTEYHEDLHRQRVLVSAHHRRQLKHVKRAKSTPVPCRRNMYDVTNQNGRDHMTGSYSQFPEESRSRLELVVRNGTRMEEARFKERINYRLTARNKPKSAHPGLMANGTPLPVLNGYHQTLVQQFPRYSQKYCNWLTRGLKVQSFHSRQTESYSHARPPPTLIQYVNRPKSQIERTPVKRTKIHVDFNVIGVQKEVKMVAAENQSCPACDHGVPVTNGNVTSAGDIVE